MNQVATVGTSEFTSSSLHDKRIVIFGGTSGIGLAAAVQAKAAGAHVTIIGSNPARAQQAANEYGLDDWRVADVTRAETISEALAGIMHVDHLVMLAGSFVVGKVHDADMSHLQRAFDERIWAAVHTIRILGDRLAADGSITFISGALADRPNAYGTAIIAAASAAMEALGRGMALELAPRRVNVLSPGPIDTPIFAKALGDGRDAYVASLSEKLPLRRLGTADEAGAAVVFVMANGWMNGEVLHVDGGARLV